MNVFEENAKINSTKTKAWLTTIHYLVLVSMFHIKLFTLSKNSKEKETNLRSWNNVASMMIDTYDLSLSLVIIGTRICLICSNSSGFCFPQETLYIRTNLHLPVCNVFSEKIQNFEVCNRTWNFDEIRRIVSKFILQRPNLSIFTIDHVRLAFLDRL